jgi:hypothetical protein
MVWGQHIKAVSKVDCNVPTVRPYLALSWIPFKLGDVTHFVLLDLDIFEAGRRDLFASPSGQQVALRRVSPDVV